MTEYMEMLTMIISINILTVNDLGADDLSWGHFVKIVWILFQVLRHLNPCWSHRWPVVSPLCTQLFLPLPCWSLATLMESYLGMIMKVFHLNPSNSDSHKNWILKIHPISGNPRLAVLRPQCGLIWSELTLLHSFFFFFCVSFIKYSGSQS